MRFRSLAPWRCGILLLSVLSAVGLAACQPGDAADTAATPEAAGTADAGDSPVEGATAVTNEEDDVLYFIGSRSADVLDPLALSEAEKAMVLRGFREALEGNARALDRTVYEPKLQQLFAARTAAAAAAEAEAGKGFIAEAAAREGAVVTESGLVLIVTEEGTGASPSAEDTVRVHYHGTLRDGTVFDSSVERGEPAQFPLNRVIPCWSEGVAMLKVGSKATLVCPPDIAYGERGAGDRIPGGAVLEFDVELLEIVDGS